MTDQEILEKAYEITKALLIKIREGGHKQFVLVMYETSDVDYENLFDGRVECRCGERAIWLKTGYICSAFTVYTCKYSKIKHNGQLI